MVVHTVAMAQCSHFQGFVWLYVCMIMDISLIFCNPINIHNRQKLLKIGNFSERSVTVEIVRLHDILKDIARRPGCQCITIPAGRKRRRQGERRQKRGCRAGALMRLRKQLHRPPFPSVFVTNARSLANKMDELKLQVTTNLTKNSCVLLFMETWFHSSILDSAIQLTGYSTHRHDRTRDSGKSRGGGLCVYVNTNWCTNTVTVDSHCFPDLKYMSVKCRPFYLPREFTVVLLTAVYIPPSANADEALRLLHRNISK